MGFKEDFRERLKGIADRLADRKKRADKFHEEWGACRDRVIGPVFEGAVEEFNSAIGQYGWSAASGRENGSIVMKFTDEQGQEYELRFKPADGNIVACTTNRPNLPLAETFTTELINERTVADKVGRLIGHLFLNCH